MAKRIFISYKRVDRDKVFALKDRIEAATGEQCWIDLMGIESSGYFTSMIVEAINACEIMLFMYSKAHAQIPNTKPNWPLRELKYALAKDKRVVIVNLDGSPLYDELLFRLSDDKMRVDAHSEGALCKLIEDIREWLQLPPAGQQAADSKDDSETAIPEEKALMELILRNGLAVKVERKKVGKCEYLNSISITNRETGEEVCRQEFDGVVYSDYRMENEVREMLRMYLSERLDASMLHHILTDDFWSILRYTHVEVEEERPVQGHSADMSPMPHEPISLGEEITDPNSLSAEDRLAYYSAYGKAKMHYRGSEEEKNFRKQHLHLARLSSPWMNVIGFPFSIAAMVLGVNLEGASAWIWLGLPIAIFMAFPVVYGISAGIYMHKEKAVEGEFAARRAWQALNDMKRQKTKQ